MVFRWESENVLFPELNLERQYRVMKCLENSSVPVPKVRWLEGDVWGTGPAFLCDGPGRRRSPSHFISRALGEGIVLRCQLGAQGRFVATDNRGYGQAALLGLERLGALLFG